MGHLSHDKGERARLGRLVEVMSPFNNHNRRLDSTWHDGIISIRIDADGVNLNDDDIATKIIKTKKDVSIYLEDGVNIKIAPLMTDHAGGGGETMESSAEAIRKKEDGLLDDLLYINNCMLHGHSKPLELAWLECLGKFGIGQHTVSQLIYNIWYIQNRLKIFFHSTWKLIVGEDWEGPLLNKCILSRWGYPLKTCTMVNSIYDKWYLFLSKLVKIKPPYSALGKTVNDAWGLIQNPECKTNNKAF